MCCPGAWYCSCRHCLEAQRGHPGYNQALVAGNLGSATNCQTQVGTKDMHGMHIASCGGSLGQLILVFSLACMSIPVIKAGAMEPTDTE